MAKCWCFWYLIAIKLQIEISWYKVDAGCPRSCCFYSSHYFLQIDSANYTGCNIAKYSLIHSNSDDFYTVKKCTTSVVYLHSKLLESISFSLPSHETWPLKGTMRSWARMRRGQLLDWQLLSFGKLGISSLSTSAYSIWFPGWTTSIFCSSLIWLTSTYYFTEILIKLGNATNVIENL